MVILEHKNELLQPRLMMSRSINPPFGAGSLASYENFEQVGEGTYGYVYRARNKSTGDTVALKKLIIHKEMSGFPICSIREIKFLKSLQHKNIVKLLDVISSKGCEHLEVDFKSGVHTKHQTDKQPQADDSKATANISNTTTEAKQEQCLAQLKRCGNLYFVFEYIEHDLGGIIDAHYRFSPIAIKCIMRQLFEVLDYLCDRKVLHRDIKSSNILVSNRHHIKLADFGLARSKVNPCDMGDGPPLGGSLTNNVITMWYKPPELLLGATHYSYGIDMWSMGCVIAELELGRPLFPGKTEPEQLDLISRTIGTPTREMWPGLMDLRNAEVMLKAAPKVAGVSLKSTYQGKISDGMIELLERILVADPLQRTTAKLALTSKFFSVPPLAPANPAELEPMNIPWGTSLHEYQTKQQRKAFEEEQRREAAEKTKNNPFLAAGPISASGGDLYPGKPSSNSIQASSSSSSSARPPPPPLPPPPQGLPPPTAMVTCPLRILDITNLTLFP